MSSFQKGWYIIYTRPRHERKVREALIKAGIECYLPERMVLKQRKDRKKYISEPLFPSYVFVFVTNMNSYYHGLGIDGANGYVKIGKELARVSDSVINDIRLIQNANIAVEVTNTYFSAGEKLWVAFGVFQGVECEFVTYKNKKMGLIRLVNQNLLITLPLNNLSSAAEPRQLIS